MANGNNSNMKLKNLEPVMLQPEDKWIMLRVTKGINQDKQAPGTFNIVISENLPEINEQLEIMAYGIQVLVQKLKEKQSEIVVPKMRIGRTVFP